MFVKHRQRLEIALDIFRGCGHSCTGCMIDQAIGGDANDIVALSKMIKEMTEHGWVAFDLGVGPTDYMTAENVNDVMEHPTFREMAQWFTQVTFNAAFLDKDLDNYTQMCQDIDEAIPGKAVRFLIPAAPGFFKTTKFGDGVSERLTYVKNALQSAYLNEAGFVVNCTRETVCDDFDQLMVEGFEIDFPVEKDDILNIPYGREKNKDIQTSMNVKALSHRISQFYKTLPPVDERHRNPDLCADTGTMVNLLYTGGKLYWVPFLKDDSPFLEDAFVIPKPWSMQSYLDTRQKALDRSLEHLKDTPCMECPLLPSCAEKGVTSIMEYLSITDCLVGLEHT